MPGYGSAYSGFWRQGVDYSLLTDGYNTFVNAPNINGTVYFRSNNNGEWMTVSNNGVGISRSLSASGGINTNFLSINGADPVTDLALSVTGQVEFDSGLVAYAGPNSWTGLIVGTDYGLYARGTTYAFDADGPVLLNGALTVTGAASKPGGGSWTAFSDSRVKKDITDFAPGLSELERVRPVRFKYNGLGGTTDNGKEYVGVVAQELEKVLPFMVDSQPKKLHPSDTDVSEIKEVDPSAFTYTLINAVQELSKQNKEMKKILCEDHPSKGFCRSSR